MAIPDYQTLMLPVLRIAEKGPSSVPKAALEIAALFGIPDEEQEALLPSGKQRILHNRIHWAKFYLGKAGLLDSPKRGVFSITEEGKAVLTNPPGVLDTKFLTTIDAFKTFYQSGKGASSGQAEESEGSGDSSTPEERIEDAIGAINAGIRADLLERIMQNSAAFFEGVIVELLVAMGYGGSRKDAAMHLGKSGDGGVDGVINEDALGLDRVYVQAKRYSAGTTVGRPDIQGFTGSLIGFNASKGVFVTTSGFSHHASEFAAKIPQSVVLIDGERLTELMIKYGVGVRTTQLVEIKRLDEDFFTED